MEVFLPQNFPLRRLSMSFLLYHVSLIKPQIYLAPESGSADIGSRFQDLLLLEMLYPQYLIFFSGTAVELRSDLSPSLIGAPPIDGIPTSLLGTFKNALRTGVTNLLRSSTRSGLTVISSATTVIRRVLIRSVRITETHVIVQSVILTVGAISSI
ncbi:hypothetical protein BGZ60DRAFT_407380 [Tricladium varicosporioides]|nr:hypothetical protein BGZ60DRAFT_407380 [Hymenoscyphus varicosporioides]